MRHLALALLALLLAAAPGPAADASADDAARLHDLFSREWELRLKQDPLTATSVGRHEYNHLLPEIAPADLARRAESTRGFLAELAKIDPARLSPQDRVNADIFRRQLEDRLADYELGGDQLPFNADSGFHMDFSQLADNVPLATVKDYENYIARLRAWPRYVGQQIEQLKLGLGRGMTVPRAVLQGYDRTISVHVVDDPEKSVFYQPFTAFPTGVPEAERERLRRAGREAVVQGAVAGYRSFLDFYQGEYLPKARTTLAAHALPGGPAYYALQIRNFTTLDLTPQQIHDIGLAEVARIDAEMREVIGKTGFQGDFAAFLQFLRSDPRFYAKTPQELLAQASWIAKRMDGKLPALFGRLPRLPYTVEPVPEHIAPKYTSGRYVGSPFGSTRAGIYWVNTFKLENRPLYNLEALTLHEAVPGHHLQIALSQELGDLPDFRRFSYISAFGEGWGLYSEWLGLEAGFYSDPYSNFGRLTYEMWRACRLVVDTGVHALGWDRQKAIDYLASHTALPLHEVQTEVDRYISWPGQALAYKMGEIKIRELRRRAERELGDRFDVRAFHDVVLGSGAVPLTVLEDNVVRYLAEQRAGTAGQPASVR
ncbi:MAG TPA: DUF885 domain-containing protein [Thermoanaerobaculia bacterium]|nr:DUF885 domain-containing protein [Thermoanaerobaculia bacterium]